MRLELIDALRVFRGVRAARHATSLAADALALTPAHAEKLMAGKTRFYTRRYSSLSRHGDRRKMQAEADAIERCMSEPLIDF